MEHTAVLLKLFLETVSRMDEMSKARKRATFNNGTDVAEVLIGVVTVCPPEALLALPREASDPFWGFLATMVHASASVLSDRGNAVRYGMLGEIASFAVAYAQALETEEVAAEIEATRLTLFNHVMRCVLEVLQGAEHVCGCVAGCKTIMCTAAREAEEILNEAAAEAAHNAEDNAEDNAEAGTLEAAGVEMPANVIAFRPRD